MGSRCNVQWPNAAQNRPDSWDSLHIFESFYLPVASNAQYVLLSPEEYVSLIDEVNDARLLTMASERMAKANPATFVPAEHLYEELGITQDALDAVGEVDIE